MTLTKEQLEILHQRMNERLEEFGCNRFGHLYPGIVRVAFDVIEEWRVEDDPAPAAANDLNEERINKIREAGFDEGWQAGRESIRREQALLAMPNRNGNADPQTQQDPPHGFFAGTPEPELPEFTPPSNLHEAAQAALGWIDYTYPPDIFDGSSGDLGPEMVVAIREALRAKLAEVTAPEPDSVDAATGIADPSLSTPAAGQADDWCGDDGDQRDLLADGIADIMAGIIATRIGFVAVGDNPLAYNPIAGVASTASASANPPNVMDHATPQGLTDDLKLHAKQIATEFAELDKPYDKVVAATLGAAHIVAPLIPRRPGRPRTLADADELEAELYAVIVALRAMAVDGEMPAILAYEGERPPELPRWAMIQRRHDVSSWRAMAELANLKYGQIRVRISERERVKPGPSSAVQPCLDELVAHLQKIAMAGVAPTQAVFDESKPATWARATSQCTRLGISWRDLIGEAGLKQRASELEKIGE